MTSLSRAEINDQSDRPSRSVARARRYQVNIAGRLRVGAHLVQVRTLNVGQGGAMLQIEALGRVQVPAVLSALIADAVVLINASCLTAPRLASVVWRRGDHVGVRFREPLGINEVDYLQRREQQLEDEPPLPGTVQHPG